MAEQLFYYLVYPGFLFAAVAGGFLSWFDRKITARVQFRKGPPVLQPFYDLVKLFSKETILPKEGSIATFLLSPVLALFGATIACVLIALPFFGVNTGFKGDLIVIFYILTIPSITYIIGAMASGNPLASVGASREMKLVISYEMTFLLVIIGAIIKSGMSISLNDVINVQAEQLFIASPSGVILFIVAIFCLQAKLCMVPFDMAEAETEITHGVFIEYSGSALAILKLTRYILLFTLPVFITALFMGGFNFHGWGILWSILEIVFVVLLLTLIRNTNPRVTIAHAMKFFLIWMNILAVAAIILSLIGL